MSPMKLSYCLAACLGGLSFCSFIGSLILAPINPDGTYYAVACLTAGVVLSCFLWWWTTRRGAVRGFNLLLAFTFAGTSGLALYTNLGFALWYLKFPLNLGIVHDGKMASHVWMGPGSLAYALFSYGILYFYTRSDQHRLARE